MSEATNISPIDIAVSGLRAQSQNMHVLANNIANAQTTNAGNGQPFRRQLMRFTASEEALSGVESSEVLNDTTTPFRQVLQPGHPDADATGYVRFPNVSVPQEMMQMITASRAYQASVAVMKRYQGITDATLELLR
jgi:flagellar basal-body rod protein FlgC